MTFHFSLRCLGQPALFSPQGASIRIRIKKHMALLVYLVVEHQRLHHRDDLAQFLWPKAKLTEARHSLTTAISALRGRLHTNIVRTTNREIRINRAYFALDVDVLLDTHNVADEFVLPLDVTGFLNGFGIPDAPEFALWKDRQQAKLLPAMKQALLSQMDASRRTGDFQQLEALAERMLDLDDLNEDAAHARMEARALAGDRVAALRIFEEWKTKLSNDLQATPSDALAKTAARLRTGRWQQPTAPTTLVVPTEQWRDRPFVGRKAEYQALYEIWERTCQGVSSHALVLGDSGVGKTTLVQRLMTTVALQGAAVSRVQCYDIDREIPYSVINMLITGLLDQPGVPATSPATLAELSRIAPEIRRRFPDIPEVLDSYGETVRIRLAEAFLDFLSVLSEERPVLLVVDDMHFADDASLGVLYMALRRNLGSTTIIFVTRTGELTLCPHASKLTTSTRSLNITEIFLKPLDEHDSRTLLYKLCNEDKSLPGPRTQKLILHAAAGYPMALELLTQEWKTNPNNSFARPIDRMTEEHLDRDPATTAYKRFVSHIRPTLTPAARKTLTLAAILGRQINTPEIYLALGLGIDEATDGITELVNRRLFRDDGNQIEFINELARKAVYWLIPSSVRKSLHRQVANQLTKNCPASASDSDLEIAWHCIRAGRTHEATKPIIDGAQKAIRSGSPHVAEITLTAALPIMKGKNKNTALLLLTEALQEQSRWHESLSALEQVDRTEGDPTTELTQILTATAERRLGCHDGSRELSRFVERLINIIQYSRLSHIRIRAATESASALHVTGDSKLAKRVLKAISSIREIDVMKEELPQLLLARALTLFSLERYNLSSHHINRAISILEDQQSINSTLVMLQIGLGAIDALLGRYTSSATQSEKAAETAFRIGNDRLHNLASANLAVTYSRLGDYNRAIERSQVATSYPYEVHYAAQQGALISHAMLGDTDTIDKLVDRWTSPIRRHYSSRVWQAWDLSCADAYLILGQFHRAETIARRAILEEFSDLKSNHCAGPYSRWLARVALADGQPSAANEKVVSLHKTINRFHRIDQAEVLVTAAWLRHKTDNESENPYSTAATQALSELPTGVIEQLYRMGMLDWSPALST